MAEEVKAQSDVWLWLTGGVLVLAMAVLCTFVYTFFDVSIVFVTPTVTANPTPTPASPVVSRVTGQPAPIERQTTLTSKPLPPPKAAVMATPEAPHNAQRSSHLTGSSTETPTPEEPLVTPAVTPLQTTLTPTIETPAALPPATIATEAKPTTAPPTIGAPIGVRQVAMTIPTYPYEAFLQEMIDTRYNTPFWRLDREAYHGAAQVPVERTFTAIILENEYLRLTFLPELGGRLYQAVFKPTGQNLFYQNQVLKPSLWGPLTPEENWWLAAGGMEWAFPVAEHGYEWGKPWGYRVSHGNDGTAIVTVWDTEAWDRPRAEVSVALSPGRSSFSVHPRILNPLPRPISYQFWINAMLTLGSTTAPDDIQFIYPTDEVIVHSRGDGSLPAGGQPMSWPAYQGRDMAQYRNWANYLGFFAPNLREDFVAAYSPSTGMGVVRAFSRTRVPGVKLFAFSPHFTDRGSYTDDNSQYFEMWGGVPRTFWEQDNAMLEPGGVMEWIEHWYPFTAIGPPVYASPQVAFSWQIADGALSVEVATTAPRSGTLSLVLDGDEILRQTIRVSPEAPFQQSVPLKAGVSDSAQLTMQFVDQAGQLIAEYRGSAAQPDRR